MALKLSVFTTLTNPDKRGDNWQDAIRCYSELADEVVIINGGKSLGVNAGFSLGNLKIVNSKWPQEFRWTHIGQQFQRGYTEASGDWVIHADIDFLFHEKDFIDIRRAISLFANEPGLSFYKWQFVLPDRYNLKSRLVVAVNKRLYGDRIKFNSGGDLCQPSLDGQEIKPDEVPEARVPLYNYEKPAKTYEQILDDVGRMARAWTRKFGNYHLGRDDKSAYKEWVQMMKGRFAKPQQLIGLGEHPIFVQRTIANLEPDQWGYNGLGFLEDNIYVRSNNA